MTGANLSMNRVSPQPSGTTWTFSASGSGGSSPYQYRWYIQYENGPWQMVRDYHPLTTYQYAPTQPGTYRIAIWARSYGSTVDAWQAYAERAFVVR